MLGKEVDHVLVGALDPVKDLLQALSLELQDNSHITVHGIVCAAITALRTGLFTIPTSGGKWNTDQCIGFLLHAYMLQKRYTRQYGDAESYAELYLDRQMKWMSAAFLQALPTQAEPFCCELAMLSRKRCTRKRFV